ncbi:MAG TPA: redoxin family protein [Bryobacteraceae bacterium]|nr:redoxin family protein [Bryobacteraceae bacterium]
MTRIFLIFALVLSAFAQSAHPILAIGSPAPDFSLPGVDGKIHKLADYASSPVLVIVFLCNHCPIASIYEQRVQKMADDYGPKGVAVVAIQPNDPEAIRVDELDSADTSDTLDEMKIRVAYKHLRYPYLYDGETQSVGRALGPQATPHVFVFDKDRKLRYQGRFDNSYRVELVKSEDARNAVEALLSGKPVPVETTGVFGCSTKWKEKEEARIADQKKIEAEPVRLEMAGADDLRKLRTNPTDKMLLVSFWATWCGPCVHEFPDVETTYRMYRVRDFDLVTVSTNMPDEKPSVLKMLERQHASSRNLLFGSEDTYALQAAFDPKWKTGVPYTVLIAPGGKILYEHQGDIDFLELRRTILRNMPAEYIGFQNYWTTE